MNATDETNPPPPPPPPPEPEPGRRLTRSTDDKVLTGLGGGLGRYFGIDPIIFRVAFVVLALAGGTGILLYLVGWLLIPDDQGRGLASISSEQNRTRQLVLAVLVGLGIVLLGGGFGWFDDGRGPDLSLALVLIAVGAAVLLSRRDRVGPGSPPPPAGPAGPTASTGPTVPGGAPRTPLQASQPDSSPGEGGVGVSPPLSPPSASGTATRPPRPRSVLVPVTLSTLAVLGGTLALLEVPLAVSLALLLLVTGGALVVGAWRGRARWLIPVALVLGMSLCAASVLDVPLRGGMGDRIYRPTTLAQLRPEYRMAVGEVVLDLRALDLRELQGRDVRVLVTDGIGHVQVLVPRGASVDAIGHAGGGEVRLFNWSWAGTDVDRRRTVTGQEGVGRLVVEARVGLGQVEVLHAEA